MTLTPEAIQDAYKRGTNETICIEDALELYEYMKEHGMLEMTEHELLDRFGLEPVDAFCETRRSYDRSWDCLEEEADAYIRDFNEDGCFAILTRDDALVLCDSEY